MSDQISLEGFEPIDQKERQFIETLLPDMLAQVRERGGPESLLEIKLTLGYTAVKYGAATAFRLCLRQDTHYIFVPRILAHLIPKHFKQRQRKSDPLYCRIVVDREQPLSIYSDLLISLVWETVNRHPSDWDCCSRYMECSDAKACVHPDKLFAFKCRYRKTLGTGRIFYGKNRNID